MNKNKVYTHVSLFSGAGGLDIGLEQAGFHTVWANDFNHDACEAHRLWSNATVVEGDIGKVDYDIIPDCDIASFGFPCQGFSLSGPRKIDDSRNVLYRHCVKLVEKKQPKLFLAENVKGLLTLGGGKIKDAIIADFESKGYVVSINLVNAADYHVPEDRQRILLVGIRKDLAEKYGVEFKVPAPFPDRISIRQALEGLAPAAEDEICKEAYSSRYMSRNRKRGWDSVSFTIPAMAKRVPLWPGSPDMVKVGKDHWLDAYCIACSVLPNDVCDKNINSRVPYELKQFRRHDRRALNNENMSRVYTLNGNVVATNRHKATKQTTDSLEEFRQNHPDDVCKLKVKEHHPTYRNMNRNYPGSVFLIGKQVHVMQGIASSKDGEATKYKDTNANSIAAGKCKFVAKNSGMLFV